MVTCVAFEVATDNTRWSQNYAIVILINVFLGNCKRIIIVDHKNFNRKFISGDYANIHNNCFRDLVLEVLMPLLKAIVTQGLFD